MVTRYRHPHTVRSSALETVRTAVERAIRRRLGARLLSVTPKKVTAEMPIGKVHVNIDGRSVNGGVIMAFADTVGAVGAMANLPPGYRTATLESKTNFFAAGEGPVISAVSVPLHIGRTTTVWQTTIRNPDRRTVAIVTQTQILLPAKPDATDVRQGKQAPARNKKTRLRRKRAAA
jgi:1,4-dihydroxy-2-naphthoyl-CoA hydrolase